MDTHHGGKVSIRHEISTGRNLTNDFTKAGQEILILHHDSATRHLHQAGNVVDSLLWAHGVIEYPGVGRQSNVAHDSWPGQAQDLRVSGTIAQEFSRGRMER